MLNKKAKVTLDAITFLCFERLDTVFTGHVNLELMDQVAAHFASKMIMFAKLHIATPSSEILGANFEAQRYTRKQWLAIFDGCQFVNGELVA